MKRNMRMALRAAAVGILLALPACQTMDKGHRDTCAACQGTGCEKCAEPMCAACGGEGCAKCSDEAKCAACGGEGCPKCNADGM